MSNILLKWIIIQIILTFLGRHFCFEKLAKRKQRALPLLFNSRFGVLNFLCGFGVPIGDLDYEAVTPGVVFKSLHFLPVKMDDLRKRKIIRINKKSFNSIGEEENKVFLNQTFTGNQETKNFKAFFNFQKPDLSQSRWFFYKLLGSLIERMNLPARPCVLRILWDSASVPFDTTANLWMKIFHIFLTPSTSKDTILHNRDYEYVAAEYLGRHGAPCDYIFKECPVSLLNKYSFVEKVIESIELL